MAEGGVGGEGEFEDRGERRGGTAGQKSSGRHRRPSGRREAPARDRIRPGKRRRLQRTRNGRRKLFDEAAQQDFLEWFAATCNLSWSAEVAGFNYKTVCRHRLNDERFAEAFNRAVRQGYARLEAKRLETKKRQAPIGIEGDRDAPDMDDMDPARMDTILREHKREIAGVRKPGRAPRVATNAEVREALIKRLKVFGIRITAGRDAAGEPADNPDSRDEGGAGATDGRKGAPPPSCGRSPSLGNPGEDRE